MITYTYDPTQIGVDGKDKMRFELGDVHVEQGTKQAYLCDEEIEAMLASNKSWKRAKLALIETLLRRFSYEVDTKVGPASWSLSQRYAAWKKMYDSLKAEVDALNSLPSDPAVNRRKHCPPYFYEGMHDNRSGMERRNPKCILPPKV